MRDFRGRVAVITGAGSGIGRALSIQLAAEGARLALSDVNEAGLAETVRLAEAKGAEVHSTKLDVADREAFHAYADDVVAHFGTAHLVINNAGVALTASVKEVSYEDFEWIMGINFWGVIHGTKAFLPHLEQNDWGHIVNISSIFGIIAVPTQGTYNATKFAVRAVTEALRQELEVEGSKVSCTSVHPGGIQTNIARASRRGGLGMFADAVGTAEESADRFDKMAQTSPEQAAEIILNAVREDQARVLVGNDAVFIDKLQRFMPTGYFKFVSGSLLQNKSGDGNEVPFPLRMLNRVLGS